MTEAMSHRYPERGLQLRAGFSLLAPLTLGSVGSAILLAGGLYLGSVLLLGALMVVLDGYHRRRT